MLKFLSSKLAVLGAIFLASDALALSTRVGTNSSPVVNLGYGSFQGQNSSDGLNVFLGMPFAAPPTGDRRFGLPEGPIPFQGIRQAVSYGAACLQQDSPTPPQLPFSFPVLSNQSEDCLFINVIRPANVVTGKKLPILFYIYGGAFEIGDTSQYDGSALVNRSIALNEPIIFVSANYRLNAFGFLGGKEVKQAGIGNAGLQDQLAALQWVQKHIAQFGGDPKRVILMGESAGAISIGLQMVANNGNTNGLFTGSIMASHQSGSPIPLPEIQFQQKWFDFLADATNCTDNSDRLKCLRQVPYDQFLAAVNKTPNTFSYQSLNLAWLPMVDGRLIVRDPLVSLQQGKYARIPFITGDAEDEGTVFSFSSLNVTTDEQFLDYVKSNFFPDITEEQLKAVASAYPADPAQGSPFHTGTVDALTPEFKRIAAFQGDYIFQGPRRNFLRVASKTQAIYAFRYERGALTPATGASHGSDREEFFAHTNNTAFIAADSVIFFANNRNPNAPKISISKLANITWEKWASSSQNPPLLTFIDPAPSVNITYDTYRQGPIDLLNKLLLTKVGRPF